MIDYVVNTLREKPELAIFLTLSIGYLLGKIRISSFELGSVTGVLLAGVFAGDWMTYTDEDIAELLEQRIPAPQPGFRRRWSQPGLRVPLT